MGRSLTLVAILLLASCATRGPVNDIAAVAPETPATAVMPTPTPDPLTEGRRLFVQICAACHGLDGEGAANDLNAPPLNADGKLHLYSDERIAWIIREGGRVMPAQGDQLNEAQIHAVIAYLRELSTALR